MANRYVFASEIRQALERGDKIITLPVGARLSPQAADMVREYKLRVTYGEPPAEKPAAPPAPPAEAAPAPAPAPPAPPAPEAAPAAPAPAAGDRQLSEEQVEAIMQRVLGKLAAAKGEPVPVPTAAPAAQPDDDMIICRCEEITKGQIRQAIKDGLATLNGVKRVTRAGMGLCQGQTCGRLVAGILARELGLKPGELDPTTARAPNRPVPMSVFAQG